MHILCLEQGDWMKPSEYPSTARDWEARQLNDFHISPNRRARDTDYPINDAVKAWLPNVRFRLDSIHSVGRSDEAKRLGLWRLPHEMRRYGLSSKRVACCGKGPKNLHRQP